MCSGVWACVRVEVDTDVLLGGSLPCVLRQHLLLNTDISTALVASTPQS